MIIRVTKRAFFLGSFVSAMTVITAISAVAMPVKHDVDTAIHKTYQPQQSAELTNKTVSAQNAPWPEAIRPWGFQFRGTHQDNTALYDAHFSDQSLTNANYSHAATALMVSPARYRLIQDSVSYQQRQETNALLLQILVNQKALLQLMKAAHEDKK